MQKIAVLPTLGRGDTLTNTVCDGLMQLERDGLLSFRLADPVDTYLGLDDHVVTSDAFADYARTADLVLLSYGKKKTNSELVDKLDVWGKTIFIDGSEVGKNNRFDSSIQKAVLDGTYMEYGGIRDDILKKCRLYLRREKPYRDGIIPFPYGIESSYIRYQKSMKKDIDFVCVFGQDEYPLLRRYVREEVIRFCGENDFSYYVEPTKTPEEFRQLLARAKVGVSVGGGGFDTLRFWEIMGNNCLLMTETIDIYQPDSRELAYKRIWQFGNLFDFRYQLERLGHFIRSDYEIDNLTEEYRAILEAHSSVARVQGIFQVARTSGLLL